MPQLSADSIAWVSVSFYVELLGCAAVIASFMECFFHDVDTSLVLLSLITTHYVHDSQAGRTVVGIPETTHVYKELSMAPAHPITCRQEGILDLLTFGENSMPLHLT